MDDKSFQFSVKKLSGRKITHSEIVKLEGFSFQKGILLAWKVFLPVPDWLCQQDLKKFQLLLVYHLLKGTPYRHT